VTAAAETRLDHLHRPGSAAFRRFNLAMVMAGLAAFGVLYAAQPLLPQLSDDFGVSPGRASLAVSASTGALALCVVPAAGLASRWGRVRTMRAGLVVAVLLSALAAAAPTFGLLVTARALSGAALAGAVAVAMGHVGSEMHPSGVGSAMGLYVAGNSLGGVSGRLLTAAVADLASWRVAMAVLSGAALLVALAFWRLLPEPVAEPSGRGGGAAVLTVARRPEVLALLLVPFTLMGAFVAVYNYLGFRLLAPPFSLPLAVAGLAFLAYLAGTLSSAVAGRLADRLGRPRVLLASMAVVGVGVLLTLPDRLPLVLVGLVVFTVGFFAAHAVASGWMPAVAAPAGAAGGAAYVCAYYAGSSVFGSTLGLAWSGAGWGGVVAGVGVLAAVATLAGLVVARAVRRRG
jgi:YNFM family putative membrane transporter